MELWEIMTSSNVRASRKGGVLTQILLPLLLFPPEDMAWEILFNVWMEGIIYDCILWVVLIWLRTMQLWETMTSSNVRAIAQYLKKIIFFFKISVKYRVKLIIWYQRAQISSILRILMEMRHYTLKRGTIFCLK